MPCPRINSSANKLLFVNLTRMSVIYRLVPAYSLYNASFLDGIEASGNSSFKWLQNVFPVQHPDEQGVSLTLAVADRSLAAAPRRGVCRVHGGGFAGTVQAFVPTEYVETFRCDIDLVMGGGACMIMRVRPFGAIRVDA